MKQLVTQTRVNGPIYRIARGGEKIITKGFKSIIGKGIELKNEKI